MVALVSSRSVGSQQDPLDTVVARLEEPGVAASLNAILDHVDLLATLVEGLSGFVARSDTIIESMAEGVDELRSTDAPKPDIAQLVSTGKQLAGAAPSLLALLPVLDRVASSDLADPALIDLASRVSRAAVRGAEQAQSESVSGLRAMLRLLKDPDIARALGFVSSVAKALGQELGRSG